MTDRDTNGDFSGLELILLDGDSLVTGAVSDQNGNYSIAKIAPGTYNLKLRMIGYRERIIEGVTITEHSMTHLDITHPDTCLTTNGRCPLNHTDNIIPIVYGFPGKKMMRRADKGKIWLAGCVITYCDPKWYCKTHKVEF